MPKYQICTKNTDTLMFSHNKLLVCGHNAFGELGLGHTNQQHSFIDALAGVLQKRENILQVVTGKDYTLVLTSQQRLLVCGANAKGELGLGHTNQQHSFIDALAGVLLQKETVLQVAAGSRHTLVLTSQQRLLVCGGNSFGQLGLGHTKGQHSFVDTLQGVLLEGERVLQVVAGNANTLVLTNQQRLLACGFNGDMSAEPQGFIDVMAGVLLEKETVLQVLTGGQGHTMVLTSLQRLLVCGDNSYGQLGLGCTGVQVGFIDGLAGVLEKEETVLQVEAGDRHTLVLTSKQRLLVCGDNSYGQLGLGHTNKQYSFIDALQGVLLEREGVLQVVAGMFQTTLLTSQHRLLICGTGYGFILNNALAGVLLEKEMVLQVAARDSYTLVLTNHHRLLVRGLNQYGQLGLGYAGHQKSFIVNPCYEQSALCTSSLPVEEQPTFSP